MSIFNIEERVKKISENIKSNTFIFDFLEAYDQPKSTISRLKKGDYNLSNNENEIIWKNKIYYCHIDSHQDVHATIDDISKSELIKKNRIRFIIVTDFETLLSIDTKTLSSLDIEISDLYKHCDFFMPLSGYEKSEQINESQVDVKASYKMGQLYDKILSLNQNSLKTKKEIHNLNIFFTRILFCFFAEDSEIFEKNIFTKTIISNTSKDGSDLSEFIEVLFNSLNMEDKTSLPNYLQIFPFVNGGLFEEKIPSPNMDSACRKILIDCGELDWNSINPDIFGSLMQAIIHTEDRKNFGMHYTSSKNILKLIKPLFLDELYNDLDKAENNIQSLNKLLIKIYNIQILDPACGSGNFLVLCYKELCRIEIEILKRLNQLDKNDWLASSSGIKLTQFYGIEVDDYACELSKLSLWIADHQMNNLYENIIGDHKPTLPLKPSGNIFCSNATRVDWLNLISFNESNIIYIVGNPPYSGSKKQTKDQKEDIAFVFKGFKSFKNLDYISCWFYLASKYASKYNLRFAFVSTKSVVQGEMVGLLWPLIFNFGVEIFFAYKPFIWSNLAKGSAGVTCVILGIKTRSKIDKYIYDSNNNTSVRCQNISPYLINFNPNILVSRNNRQISNLKEMLMGNQPRDGGNFILNLEEYNSLLNEYPNAIKFIKKYVGANELIKNHKRWCLWIKDDLLDEAIKIPFIKDRIDKVKKFRLSSNAKSTLIEANFPHKFVQIQHEPSEALVIPTTTASRREYLPLNFVDDNTVLSNLVFGVYKPPTYLFGILSSRMHSAWLKIVSGRFGDSIRYSNVISYNSFCFPDIDENCKNIISQLSLDIIDIRERYPEKSLVDLYDPKLMPENLKKAHHILDNYIDSLYRKKSFADDYDRLEHLFELYSSGNKTINTLI